MDSVAELISELEQLDARIQELRGAHHLVTLDLSEALRERDRLQRHLNWSIRQERGEHGSCDDVVVRSRAT